MLIEDLKAEVKALEKEIINEENSTPDRVWLNCLKGQKMGLELAIRIAQGKR